MPHLVLQTARHHVSLARCHELEGERVTVFFTFADESCQKIKHQRGITNNALMMEAAERPRFPLLAELWQQEELVDVVLRSADGQAFKCHKIILAGSSSFFRALFGYTGSHMADSRQHSVSDGLPVIQMPAISGATLESVLHFLYARAQLQPELCNVEELLQASTFMQLEGIRESCCQVCVSPGYMGQLMVF